MIETYAVSESNTPKPADDPSLGEIVDTVKAYAKQETIGPLKGAGRWLGFGAAAALFLGIGLVFVLVGLLRLLQTEWDRSASGSLSWLAYLITFAAAAVILAITISRIKKSTLNNEPK
ncbi:MAG: phage holin family protein [Actinomycetota bacterium]